MVTYGKPWDVVVVGGGPAGLAAAITARKYGLATLLFDHREPPVETIGKALHPGVEIVLERLGVASAFRAGDFMRSKGHYVGKSGIYSFIPYRAGPGPPWRGFELYGSQVRDILKRRFMELGGEVVEAVRVSGVTVSKGRVTGVRLGDRVVAADLVVDASGSQGFLRRSLDLIPLFGSPRLFSSYSVGECAATYDQPTMLCQNDRWHWTARLSDGRLSQVNMNLRGRKYRAAGEKAAEVTWRMLPACAGTGYVVAGDAAVRLDPARGGGVLRALMSGIWAIALFNRDPDCDSARMAPITYREWMTRWARADAAALAGMYLDPPFNVRWPRLHHWSEKPLPLFQTASS